MIGQEVEEPRPDLTGRHSPADPVSSADPQPSSHEKAASGHHEPGPKNDQRTRQRWEQFGDLIGWRLVGFPGHQFGYPDPYINRPVDLPPVAVDGPPVRES